MANLLVEIGNTALKAAWSCGNVLGKTFRYQGEKSVEFILSITEKEKPDVLTLNSSRLLTEEELQTLAKECTRLVVVDDLRRSDESLAGIPEYLTSDRVASVVAARYMFRDKACTVFDFGTTLTIDFINSDGSYRGGVISPGCRTRFKSLNRYAKALPLIDTPSEVKEIGDSLENSMGTGVVSGIMFEIDGYMHLFPENVSVFTGGDAMYFANKAGKTVFTVNNLVLVGLAIITDEYVKKINS